MMQNQQPIGMLQQLQNAVSGSDRNASDRLAIALMSLSGASPSLQPMIAMANQGMQQRQKLEREQAATNKSLEYLQKAAQTDPLAAQLLQAAGSGAMNAGQAVTELFNVKMQDRNRKLSARPQTSYNLLAPEEIAAAGLPVGTVAQRSSTGQVQILQSPQGGDDTKTIKGADGFNYYLSGPNAGKRVLPNVQAQQKPEDTTADLTNFSELQKTIPGLTFKDYLANYKNKAPLQNKGTYRVDGEIIGDVLFDPGNGQHFQIDKEGERRTIDMTSAFPVTDATFSKAIPTHSELVKLQDEVADDRTSMKRMGSYMQSVVNTNEGFARLGDQMTGAIKTLLSGVAGDDWTTLSQSELNLKIAQGQLQGLIGRLRLETVGGGVMTEQDALRIIYNLGGDVNALQNKEVVAAQIKNLFRDKSNSFERKRKQYNAAVEYGPFVGFEPYDPFEMDMSVFDISSPSEKINIGDVQFPASTSLVDEQQELQKMSNMQILSIDITTLTPRQIAVLHKVYRERGL